LHPPTVGCKKESGFFSAFSCEAKMSGSLSTKLLRPILGLAIVAGMSLFASCLQASCGDYVQFGQSAHVNGEASVTKSYPDSMQPVHAGSPLSNRPCTGPHCGRQPTQMPLPAAPVSTTAPCDQWALPVAQLQNLSADNEFPCADAQPRAPAAHLFRIERPPRLD
jgi:hypothetical protein